MMLHSLLAALCLQAAGASANVGEAPIRVMTFNVRLPLVQDGGNAWEKRRDILVRTISQEQPDLIGTQELHKPQGDYIVAHLPNYSWFGTGRRGGRSDEHMGIFYRRDRFRIVESGDFWLSDTPEIPGSLTWDHPYPRMVTWALMETIGGRRQFYIYNTHLPYRAEDEPARLKGASLLLDRIAALPSEIPLVVTGDFNTEPGAPVHALLTQSLTDVRSAASTSEGPSATFHAFTGTAGRRIDWILTRGFKPLATRTVTTNQDERYPSDHFPVVADLGWPSGKRQ